MKKHFLCFVLCLALLLPVGAYGENIRTVTFAGKEYPLIQGYYYARNPMEQTREFYFPFFYSDGYFALPSTEYNVHLAAMSLNAAVAASYHEGEEYRYRHGIIRRLLADIGCDDQSIYINDAALIPATETSIGYVIANKDISLSDDASYTLVPIMIRGHGYGMEWASNFVFGASGEAEGFSLAAEQVFSGVEDYLRDYGLWQKAAEGRVKFWLIGYSRGASVANLTAKRITDKYGTQSVYAYTWEAALCNDDAQKKSGVDYGCIHNMANYADVITAIPPINMGMKLYGTVHNFPAADASAYAQEREKMVRQLATIDKDYVFDDEFSLAHMELTYADLLHIIPKGIETVPVDGYVYKGSVNKCLGDWQRKFADSLLQWGLKSREDYVKEGLFSYQGKPCPSIQEALCTYFGIFFGTNGLGNIGAIGAYFSPLLAEIGNLEKLDLYNNIIKNWNGLSQSKKEDYIETYWNKVEKSGAFSSFSAEDQAAMKRCWPTLLYMLLPFVNKDYTSSADLFGEDSDDVHEVFVGTAVYNGLRAFIAHDYLINLAWIRSYDSYYDDIPANGTAPGSTVTAPVAYVNGAEASASPASPTAVFTDEKIMLDEPHLTGEIIFYDLEETSSGEKIATEQIYRGGVLLPASSEENAVYKLTAYAHRDGVSSAKTSYYFSSTPKLSLSAQAGLVGVYCTAVNGFVHTGPVHLLAASYDDGKLVEIQYVDLEDFSRTAERILLPITYNSAYDYRVFLLDAKGDYVPLYKMQKCKKISS